MFVLATPKKSSKWYFLKYVCCPDRVHVGVQMVRLDLDVVGGQHVQQGNGSGLPDVHRVGHRGRGVDLDLNHYNDFLARGGDKKVSIVKDHSQGMAVVY